MFEFGKGSAYMVFNCRVDKTFVVVPFKVQATIESVLVFNNINEAEGVIFEK